MTRFLTSSTIGFALSIMFIGCAGLRVDRVMRPSEMDWTMYGGKSGRANMTGTSIQPPLEQVWQYSAQGGLLGCPLVRDSVMVVGTLNGELQAVNLTNGKRLGYKALGSAIVGTPVLDGSSVIVTMASKDETLLSYDLRDGRRTWIFPAGPIETSPLVLDDRIYVATLRGVVYCVEKRTGEQVWELDLGTENEPVTVRSSPSSDGKNIFFGSDNGVLYAVDRAAGTVTWKNETGASIFATSISVSGIVIVGDLHGRVFGVDCGTGKTVWMFETGSKVYGPASTNSTAVFIGTADGTLFALDPHGGREIWSFKAKSVINSAPLVAGSLLYVGSLDKTLHCIEAGSGKEIWSFVADGRIKVTPVLWGDFLLVTSEDKYITALRPVQPL